MLGRTWNQTSATAACWTFHPTDSICIDRTSTYSSSSLLRFIAICVHPTRTLRANGAGPLKTPLAIALSSNAGIRYQLINKSEIEADLFQKIDFISLELAK